MADLFLRDKLEVTVPVAAVLTGALVLLPMVMGEGPLGKFPLVGKELGSAAKRRQYYFQNALNLHATGYKKFRDAIFRVTEAEGDVIILPIRYLEELRKIPDASVSNDFAVKEIMQHKYTGVSVEDPLMNHVVRSDLTHKLPHLVETLSAEVKDTVTEYLGEDREWKAINITDALLPMIAVISGRIFLGPELNRSKEYLHASINYTIDAFTASTAIREWPKWLRPVGKFFVPAVAKVEDHKRLASEFLVPVIKARRARMAAGDSDLPDDMLQWMMAKAGKFDSDTPEKLAEIQLVLSFAAIHTTTMMATFAIYDIIGYCPEILPELRAEIKAVLAANDNVLSTQALFQMKLLDSVLRETQRYNPAAVASFRRNILQDVTLSDGTFLPKGSVISVPQHGVAFDPALYPDPTVYNPYRFRDIRVGGAKDPLGYANKEQHQFISVNKENTAFGYGRHACPGRFFAANEIKLLLVRILLSYDIKMPPGETVRYKNLSQHSSIVPDPTKNIMIRYVGEE